LPGLSQESRVTPTRARPFLPGGVRWVVPEPSVSQACPSAIRTLACGDYAVNTIQPANSPTSGGTPTLPAISDKDFPKIGDRLGGKGIDWNWYSGGWDDAVAGRPGPLFQYHHQPLNYWQDYGLGRPGRAHLQDETKFFDAAKDEKLPRVSFLKPYGAENEHSGYASEPDGSDHLVKLIKAVLDSPQAGDTLIVVTYDEFGGQWDHVAPPAQGSATVGVSDTFGPGTRIPALLVSSAFRRSGVDHTVYDTTSILATIEHGLGLKPLDTRDAHGRSQSAVRIGSHCPIRSQRRFSRAAPLPRLPGSAAARPVQSVPGRAGNPRRP
jgi:acid phosphatase